MQLMSAWEMQPIEDYEAVWSPFDREFCFRPSTRQFPGYREPADSVTYHIGHVYGDAESYTRLTVDLSRKLIRAFRHCVDRGDFINVLDWPHPSYRFWPHASFDFKSEDEWPIPALPNGDYFIFISQDQTFGILGHPWEQTMCVFGRSLLDAFDQDMPDLFDTPVRTGGKPL